MPWEFDDAVLAVPALLTCPVVSFAPFLNTTVGAALITVRKGLQNGALPSPQEVTCTLFSPAVEEPGN